MEGGACTLGKSTLQWLCIRVWLHPPSTFCPLSVHRFWVRKHRRLKAGRGVWESNPPGTPLRRPPTVLKTATVTGPQTPPGEDRREDHQSMMQKLLHPTTHVFHTLLHSMGGNQCVCPMRPLPISMPYMVSHHKRSAGTARNTLSSPSGVEAGEACGGLCFCQKTSKTLSER